MALSYTDMSMGGGGLENKKIAYMTVNPKGTSTLLPSSGETYDLIFKNINMVSEKSMILIFAPVCVFSIKLSRAGSFYFSKC